VIGRETHHTIVVLPEETLAARNGCALEPGCRPGGPLCDFFGNATNLLLCELGIARDLPRSQGLLVTEIARDERETAIRKRGKPWPGGQAFPFLLLVSNPANDRLRNEEAVP
jgi:hypothetical protein